MQHINTIEKYLHDINLELKHSKDSNLLRDKMSDKSVLCFITFGELYQMLMY